MRLDPDQLAALSQVLDLGSFERAASELGVTPSAISLRIKALEERIGATLVRRGTPCTATPVGERLARHAEALRLLETGLARDLDLPTAAGRLRIAVNADSLATWFVDALAAMPEGLLFDLVIKDQDHSADGMRDGAFGAAVTAQAQPVTGCNSVELGALRYVATASPDFVARWFADGVEASALAVAPCLTFDTLDGLQADWMSRVAGHPMRPPSHRIPSSRAFVDAALAGIGWGMNPEPLVRAHLREGRLVELVAGLPLDTALYWQVSRVLAPALAPVTRAVRQAARRHLITP